MDLVKTRNKLPYFIFFLFVLMQAWTLIYIVQFGDDYYYTTFLSNGIRHFIDENVLHYMQTNGRALVHILDEILLANGTVFLWKIINLAVISLTVWFSAKLVAGNDKKQFDVALAVSCVAFTAISILNLRQSVYWATGSMNYLFPVFLTLLLFYKLRKNVSSDRLSPLVLIIAFFACSSTEQAAFASLITVILFVYTSVLNKKRLAPSYVLCLLLAVVGFILLFAAPGNAIRKTYYPDFYSMPFLKRIAYNLPRIISLVFSDYGFSSVIAIYLSASALFNLARGKNRLNKICFFFSLAGAIALILKNYLGTNILLYISFPCTAISILINFLSSIGDARREHDLTIPFFTIMPVVLQGAMLVSPEFGPRTTLISAVMLIVPTAKMLLFPKRSVALVTLAFVAFLLFRPPLAVTVMAVISFLAVAFFVASKKHEAVIVTAIFICAILVFSRQFTTVHGYRENYVIHKYNDEKVAQYLDNSDFTLPLEQYYLSNDVYKYTMPYDDPYHAMWYKISRGIPQSVEIVYSDKK